MNKKINKNSNYFCKLYHGKPHQTNENIFHPVKAKAMEEPHALYIERFAVLAAFV